MKRRYTDEQIIGIMKGAKDTILAARPTIFLSVHPKYIKILGGSINELSQLIDDLGYDCFDHLGHKVEAPKHDDYILRPRQAG